MAATAASGATIVSGGVVGRHRDHRSGVGFGGTASGATVSGAGAVVVNSGGPAVSTDRQRRVHYLLFEALLEGMLAKQLLDAAIEAAGENAGSSATPVLY